MSKQKINGDLGYLHEGDTWSESIYKTKHEILNQWLRSKKSTGKSLQTLNAYSRTAVDFFHQENPDKTPEEIRVEDIERWIQKMDQRDLSQNTKRRYIESLSSFYDWAGKRRGNNISYNPPAVVLEDLSKVIRERPEKATWENGAKICRHISDPRDKAIAALMAKTGCRVKEACTLKESDLMLEDGFVRFKNRKGGNSTVNPVDDEMIQALQRASIYSDDSSDYIFTSRKGGRICQTRVLREVRKAAENAGVTEDKDVKGWHSKFTPHFYRTIWTSLMRNGDNRMPDHFVRYLRGDSAQEVMDIYTRHPRDKIRSEYLDVIRPLHLF